MVKTPCMQNEKRERFSRNKRSRLSNILRLNLQAEKLFFYYFKWQAGERKRKHDLALQMQIYSVI
jgi:hypothetical protein